MQQLFIPPLYKRTLIQFKSSFLLSDSVHHCMEFHLSTVDSQFCLSHFSSCCSLSANVFFHELILIHHFLIFFQEFNIISTIACQPIIIHAETNVVLINMLLDPMVFGHFPLPITSVPLTTTFMKMSLLHFTFLASRYYKFPVQRQYETVSARARLRLYS